MYFETPETEPECVLPDSQIGFGLTKYGSQYLSPCQVFGCEECYQDASKCTKCFGTIKKVLNENEVYSCVIPSNLFGIDTANPNFVKPCWVEVPGCRFCDENDYKTCTECDGTKKFYRHGDALSCIEPSKSYGIDPKNSDFVKACSEGTLNCESCDQSDYTKCTSCGLGYKLTGTLPSPVECVVDEGDPQKGPDLEPPQDSSVKQKNCSVDGCKKCEEDPKKCKECLAVGGVDYKVNLSGQCSPCLSSDSMFSQGNYCLNCDQKCRKKF